MSRIDPASLLRIDVAAGLERFREDLFQGAFQMPAELVRLATSRGATLVEMALHRGGFEMASDQEPFGPDVWRDLERLRRPGDGGEAASALARLESMGCSALVSLRAEVRTLSIEESGTTRVAATFARGRFDARRAREWVLGACRFSPAQLVVDGRPRRKQGFRESLAVIQVHEPLPASISIPRSGTAPRLWLLEHGVISARATLPGVPCFQAAVEMAGIARQGDHEDGLVKRLHPYVETLARDAVKLMIARGREIPRLGAHEASRIRALLLQAAEAGLQRVEIEALPLVPGYLEGAATWFRLSDLERILAERGAPRVLHAGDAIVGQVVHVVLPPAQRSKLASLLRADLVSVGASPGSPWLSEAVAAALGWARRHLRRLRHLFGRQLAESELTSSENELARSLSEVTRLEVRFLAGASPPRVARADVLWLGREHADVLAACRALRRGPRWIYPVALSLLDGARAPSEPSRIAWHARLSPPA